MDKTARNEPVNYAEWVGARESVQDELAIGPALSVRALLDNSEAEFRPGDPLPPAWQWFYFLPRARQSGLGTDGHPQRGGFLPPVALPRRMFAGGRLTVHAPLQLGRPAIREGEILKVSEKRGGSGLLVFVTVAYRFLQENTVCLVEEQDIVYREPGAPATAPEPADLPSPPAGAWTRMVTPDSRLLFRFSAVTFNAHRIHYDRPYAMEVEGYPGLVVHGPLTAVLLMDLVRRHTDRSVTHFSFRAKAPLFDLAPFRLTAVAGNESMVSLEAQAPDGGVAMTAEVRLG